MSKASLSKIAHGNDRPFGEYLTIINPFAIQSHCLPAAERIALEKKDMEKILLVINATRPQFASIRFACHLAALTNSKLTGLFIESLYAREERETPSGDSYFDDVAAKGTDAPVITDTSHAVTLFTRECALQNIRMETVVDKGEPIQDTLRESRYADLLIVDPGTDFYDSDERLPSHFTKEIMANAECPVILSPEKTTAIEEVVFCYNGSASSVFAIKQFTYHLPLFKNTKVLLLEAKSGDKNEPKEGHLEMLKWLQAHYNHVDYKTLSGDANDALFTHFFMKEKKMVVMGSYGRTALSTLFRGSAADSLIRAVDLPLFITHFNG